jgi:putative tryptophan/tyrosine transport system substrate-binding protein
MPCSEQARAPPPAGVRVKAPVSFSYGPDSIKPHCRAAGYIDCIPKREKSADLSVQAPTKFELVINAQTARMLGLAPPPTLLSTADEE